MALSKEQITDLLEREQKARSAAATWRSHVQQCAELFKPRSAKIEMRGVEGDKRHVAVWNGTPEDALDVAAAGIHSETMPQDAPWALLEPASEDEGEDKANTAWCQEATKKVMAGIHESNFGVQSHEAIVDLLYAGIANTFMKEGKRVPFQFSTRPPMEYVYFEDEEGEVDTVMGTVELTARAARKQFGTQAGEPVLRALKDKRQDDKFAYLHVVMPREGRDAGKGGIFHARWVEYYILKGEKHLAWEKGYYEFPFLVPRGSKQFGELAGRSQAMKALGVGNALQVMEVAALEAGERRVKPSLVAADSGWREAITAKAGTINYTNLYQSGGTPPVSEMPGGGDPSWGREEIEIKEEKLARYFCVRAFEMEEIRSDVTLGERQMRKLEKVKQIAPLLMRFWHEYIRKVVMRGVMILIRRGDLPEPPPGLGKVKITARSPLFLMLQHGADLEAVDAVYEAASKIAEKRLAFGESPVFDFLDDDAALQVIQKRWNVPSEVLRAKTTVQQMRKAKAEEVAAQQQQEALAQGVDMAAKLGGSDVDVPAVQ